MKKILTLLLVLLLSLTLMVGCEYLPNFGIGNGGETPETEVDADLQAAYDYIHQMTKTISEKTGANYTVNTVAVIGDKTFNVVWTVSDDRITITPDENGLTATVAVPEPAEDINYTLKFTVTNEKGETLSKEYNHIVPKFAYNTFAEYAAAEDDEPLVVCGIVTGVFSKATGSQANGLYIQDLNNDGGYYVYNLTDDPNGVILPGMTVKVKGVKDTYNGTYELVQASVEIVDSTIKTVTPVDYTELLNNASALSDAELVAKQSLLVVVKGATILEAGDNGYYYFQAGAHKVYLRISSSNNACSKADLEVIKSAHSSNYGNLADITGVITQYNGNFYLSPVGADMISNIQVPERTDAEKVQMELDTLKLDSKITADKVITLLANGANFTDVTFSWTSDSEHAVIADGKLTITIPDEKVTITVSVTATCGDASDSKTFNVVLSKEVTPLADIIALGSSKEHNTYTTEKYLVGGIITEVYNDQYGNMYITDNEGNVLTIYGTYDATGTNKYGAMESKPVAGDYVVILGVVGQYNGTPQVKNGWIISWTTPTSVKDAIDLGAAKDHNDFTGDKILVTGTITEVYNAQYGNMYITDAEGNVLTIYGSYDATGNKSYKDLTYKPVVGDTVTILGVPGRYNDTKQIKNGWIVAVTKGENSNTPSDNLAEGVFNLGMVHEGVGTDVYYVCGGMASTYYFATSSDASAALAVRFEETTGGYYMYVTIDGVKTYINFVVSGTYVNSKYETTASTVFTYDATLETVVAAINGENYILGTSAEKTFTTVGPVKASGNNYYCKLLAASEGSVCEHEDTTTTTVDATCTAKGSTTVVCNDCGKTVSVTEIAKIAHSYTNGACSVCGAAQPAAGTQTTASKSIADLIVSEGWSSSTTSQEFALDGVVTVDINGGSNTGKAYNGDHIRIYATDSPAGTMTISVSAGYELVSIKITTVTEEGPYAFFYLGDGTVDICNVETAVSGSSVVLTAVKNGSNGKQVRVLAIEVVYKAV